MFQILEVSTIRLEVSNIDLTDIFELLMFESYVKKDISDWS